MTDVVYWKPSFNPTMITLPFSVGGRALKASGLRASLDCEWRSMFDFNLIKITAEQIQSGRTLSEALEVAEARRIYLSVESSPLSSDS